MPSPHGETLAIVKMHPQDSIVLNSSQKNSKVLYVHDIPLRRRRKCRHLLVIESSDVILIS